MQRASKCCVPHLLTIAINDDSFTPTYDPGGHPVSCAVGLETLAIYDELRPWENVEALAPLFQGFFRERYAGHPAVGEVRGQGFMLAVELVPTAEAPAPATILANAAMELGLLVRSTGKVAVMAPSLAFTQENFEEMFDKFDRAFKRFEAEVGA